MSLKYDEVFYNRITKENERKFNCSVPFHPPTISKVRNGDIEICENAVAGKKAYDHFWKNFNAGILSAKDNPCAGFDIFLGLPFINDDRVSYEAFIRVYMKFKIKVKSVVIYYDSTTLAAEVGGYIGMLLGVSLVDLVILSNVTLVKIFKRSV